MSSTNSSSPDSLSPLQPYSSGRSEISEYSEMNPTLENHDTTQIRSNRPSYFDTNDSVNHPINYTLERAKEDDREQMGSRASSPFQCNPIDSFWITSKEISKIRQLPYMTGMRALATIMIELFHITKEGSRCVYYFTWIALTIHFVQGAFLITGSLLALQSKSKSRYDHLPQFFANRWARLYPAVIVVMLVNSIWWLARYHDIQHLTKMLIRVFFKITQTNILAVPNYPPNPFANMWFLDVQEHFYIFWALLLPFITRFTTRGRIVCLTLLFIFSFRKRLQEGFYNATLPLNLYKMVCGASLYLLPLPRFFVTQYASQAAIFLSIAGFIWGLSSRFAEGFSEDQHRMYGDNIGILIIVLVIMAAIGKSINESDPEYQRQRKVYLAQRHAEEEGQQWIMIQFCRLQDFELLSLLDANWLNFIGRISYSWYLWQIPLMHLEGNFRSGWSGFGPTCEAFLLSLISTFAIEEPIRNAYSAYRKRLTSGSLTISADGPSISQKQYSPLTEKVQTSSSSLDKYVSLQMPFITTLKSQTHQE